MNSADVTAFDERLDTFAQNLNNFKIQLAQMQEQIKNTFKQFGIDEPEPVQSEPVQINPEPVQINPEPVQKTNTTQEAMDIINSIDIPSLLGESSQASQVASSAPVQDAAQLADSIDIDSILNSTSQKQNGNQL